MEHIAAEEQPNEKTLQIRPTSSLNVLARHWSSRQQRDHLGAQGTELQKVGILVSRIPDIS